MKRMLNHKNKKTRRNHKRYSNGGRITRGSGRIDYSAGPNHFTVDDVPARVRETGEELLVGADEFIINSRSAKTLGYDFLEKLNRTGLVEGGGFRRGVLPESNYQAGGRITTQNDCNDRNRIRTKDEFGNTICK